MNEYERLIAYMKVAYNNMTTLHRHLVKDAGWFGNHAQLGEWYEEIGEQLDDLTERGLALRYAEPSIKDAVLYFSSDVIATTPRRLEETYTMAMEIFRGIAGMMGAAEPITPRDVQNKLQEYEYFWNKEANYKLAHALGDVRAPVADPRGRADIDDD